MENDLISLWNEFWSISEVRAAATVIGTSFGIWVAGRLKGMFFPGGDVKALPPQLSVEAQKILDLLKSPDIWKIEESNQNPKDHGIWQGTMEIYPNTGNVWSGDNKVNHLFTKPELKRISAEARSVLNTLIEKKKAEQLAAEKKSLQSAIASAESFRKLTAVKG